MRLNRASPSWKKSRCSSETARGHQHALRGTLAPEAALAPLPHPESERPRRSHLSSSRRTVPRPRGTLPRRSKACWSSLRQVRIPPFRLPHLNTSSLQKPILLSHSVALTSRLCLKAENRNAIRSSSVSHSTGKSPSGAGATRASSGEDIYASPRLLAA